jgi:hypothetical protein
MAFISKRNRRREREIQQALNNRLELVKEGFTRRDLIKMGLMTSAGVLIAKGGLTHAQWGGHNGSSCYGNNCNVGCSPKPAQVFIDPMPIPPELPSRPLSDPGLTFGAPPQQFPFNTINPATGLPYEGRGQYNGTLRPGTDFFSSLPSTRRRSITSSASEQTTTSGSLRTRTFLLKQSGDLIWAAAPPATSRQCQALRSLVTIRSRG